MIATLLIWQIASASGAPPPVRIPVCDQIYVGTLEGQNAFEGCCRELVTRNEARVAVLHLRGYESSILWDDPQLLGHYVMDARKVGRFTGLYAEEIAAFWLPNKPVMVASIVFPSTLEHWKRLIRKALYDTIYECIWPCSSFHACEGRLDQAHRMFDLQVTYQGFTREQMIERSHHCAQRAGIPESEWSRHDSVLLELVGLTGEVQRVIARPLYVDLSYEDEFVEDTEKDTPEDETEVFVEDTEEGEPEEE